MKTRKINGIEKSVCCCEQKIAYNLAFRAHINFGDKFQKLETASEKQTMAHKIRDILLKDFDESALAENNRYNKDAIFVALNQGLSEYLDHPFIACDYDKISEAFPIPYAE